MVENTSWRTGGVSSTVTVVSKIYESEGSNLGASSSSTKAIGYVGLMSASDYGYASSGCYNKDLYQYFNSNCISINWLYYGETEWTITPSSNSLWSAITVAKDGGVGFQDLTIESAIRPALYLKSSVYITGGTGTKTNPYTIAIDG